MRKILASVLMIALVSVAVASGTMAYFNDVETSTQNIFNAGTIDIAVDQENPWSKSYEVTYGDSGDLKPCETGVIQFTIENVGTNPAVLWKHIKVDSVGTGTISEPEVAWENKNGENNAIDEVINYDMSVGGRVIFLDADGLSVDDIQCMWMPIGTLLPRESVTVVQSYHLRPDVENWAQGDVMTFTMDLYAEQRMGPGPNQLSSKLFLDNKTGDPNWYFVVDQTWGILDWTAGASAATLLAQGLQASTGYSLITWDDTTSTCSVIVAGSSDSFGKLSLSGLTVPPLSNGKIWLVPSSDVSGSGLTWANTAQYLWESNLVTNP